jgi:hypothetical protein
MSRKIGPRTITGKFTVGPGRSHKAAVRRMMKLRGNVLHREYKLEGGVLVKKKS